MFEIPTKSLKLLSGGANNRVYLLNDTYVVKEYFIHPDDPRNRLETEYNFLKFAWECGLRQIPEPLQRNKTQGLYSKIPGEKVAEATSDVIKQALAFFMELNLHHQKGVHLPLASEASLSLSSTLQAIKTRLDKLKIFVPKIADQLTSLYNACLNSINQCEKTLSLEELRLSPSDFGLHNVLLDGSKAYFLDFEYAGWDDPAKTICDFFTSPRIFIPKDLFWLFSHTVAKTLPDPKGFYERLRIHYPLSQIKWCCVILNVFLKTENERRFFAKSDQTSDLQMEKAEKYLQSFSMEIPNGLC